MTGRATHKQLTRAWSETPPHGTELLCMHRSDDGSIQWVYIGAMEFNDDCTPVRGVWMNHGHKGPIPIDAMRGQYSTHFIPHH